MKDDFTRESNIYTREKLTKKAVYPSALQDQRRLYTCQLFLSQVREIFDRDFRKRPATFEDFRQLS